ncbi:hypothetical protein LTR28_008692 [Elasticomyces elasticus]|nr:hypothetical protein LTR28_008692 [Elasticomyces elasticus]
MTDTVNGSLRSVLEPACLLFYYDYDYGTRQVQRVPNQMRHYKTFSVYMNQSTFWIFPDDATTNPTVNWSRMNFDYPADRNLKYPAYVGFAGEFIRMRFQHEEQRSWFDRLLPDRYHAIPTHPSTAENRAFGGLIGELPMIIALIAFSVGPPDVEAALQHCMVGPRWRLHNRAPREGCM